MPISPSTRAAAPPTTPFPVPGPNMAQHSWLTERFEENRPRLRGVAYRMLGSLSEAEDAVQEAWLRLNGIDTATIETWAAG